MSVLKELEKAIEQRLVKGLKKRGVPNVKLNVMYSRGWPDRLIFIPGGRPFLCELKRPGETLTPLQEEVHAQLKALGYDVETHWSSDTALDAVFHRLNRVGSSRVPEEGGPVATDPRRRRPVSRPRTR